MKMYCRSLVNAELCLRMRKYYIHGHTMYCVPRRGKGATPVQYAQQSAGRDLDLIIYLLFFSAVRAIITPELLFFSRQVLHTFSQDHINLRFFYKFKHT